MATIFISHSHSDWRLAQRLQELIKQTSGNRLQIARSSEKGAIKVGESWRDWIDEKVSTCDVAIILLTPASLRGRWVLWEAGAVAGIQLLGSKETKPGENAASSRRVRVLHFNFDKQDLGPFGTLQVCHGLDAPSVVQFVAQLLTDFKDDLGEDATLGLLGLKEAVMQFVADATKDLRYTPVDVSEGLVQDWLSRLDEAKARQDDAWIIAARRWINIAFLGAERAGAHEQGEAIDFRLHVKIADAHRRLRDWLGVIQQLSLALKLSPNDLVVLRDLGRAYREAKNGTDLTTVLQIMHELDRDIFKKDREAITLRCGYLSDLGNLTELRDLLAAADESLVAGDGYLLFWRAFSVMRVGGARASEALFQQLRQLLASSKGFWNEANRVNAHIALGELDEAASILRQLGKYSPTPDQITSGTRYYDDISNAFERRFDWRSLMS